MEKDVKLRTLVEENEGSRSFFDIPTFMLAMMRLSYDNQGLSICSCN